MFDAKIENHGNELEGVVTWKKNIVSIKTSKTVPSDLYFLFLGIRISLESHLQYSYI